MYRKLPEIEEDNNATGHAGYLQSEEMGIGQPCDVLSQLRQLRCRLLEIGEHRAWRKDADLRAST